MKPVLFFVFGVILLQIGCSRKDDLTLDQLMERIPSWSDSTNYAGWDEVYVAAKKMQTLSSGEVVHALERFSTSPNRSQIDGDAAIPYLLFRVAFDVSTNSVERPEYFKVWRGVESATNSDGTYNISWPVGWRNDRIPFLMQANRGAVDNAPYNLVEEYKHFEALYPWRKFEEVNDSGQP
jgi:hypothetical protein